MPALSERIAITYRKQYRRCGKPTCKRCEPGRPGHGPYWYAFWYEDGHAYSRYVGKELPVTANATPSTASELNVGQRATAEELEDLKATGTALVPPKAAPLRVRTLGAFTVWRGEELIPDERWARRKVATLFKLLLGVPAQRLDREQATEALWPEANPAQGAANLRSTLRFLRAALDGPAGGPSYLRTVGATLILEPYPGTTPEADWLDALAFSRAAAAAVRGRDRQACHAALARYTGLYLPEDEYEDWAAPQRTHLRRQRETLLLHLATLAEEADDREEVSWCLRAVLADDPCHEHAARTLMASLLTAGRQTEALRVYQALVRALWDQLEVRPERQTEALRAHIRLPAVPQAPEPTIPTNLPAPLTRFIGRGTELAALEHLLGQGQVAVVGSNQLGSRLVTLTGAGGGGKTRLALGVAAAVLDAYPDGVWLVELAPLLAGTDDPTPVAAAALSALGLREQAGLAQLATLIEHLRRKRLLLILDNCEHLIAACAGLAAHALSACWQLQILATSREALGMGGETVWPVPPLSLPPRLVGELSAEALERLARSEAVQLFVARAQASKPDFALNAATAESVVAICRRLDGLPLAIELAAAQLDALPVRDVEARLDDRFRLLRRGNRTALPRHQTLRATIDWSYELLKVPERVLLCRLAVFADGWTLPAAEAVCADEGVAAVDVLALLSSLAGKSLLVFEEVEGAARYRLLETVRQYAWEHLAASEEIAAVRTRQLTWCLELAERAEPLLIGPEQGTWLARLEREYDNFRAALVWAQEHEAYTLGLRLATALSRFCDVRGYLHEGHGWLEQALRHLDQVPAAVYARGLSGAGRLAWSQGDFTRARRLHEESLALHRGAGDQKMIAVSLNDLGNARLRLGDYAQAQALFEESLALWRQLDDGRGISIALANLGLLASDLGSFGQARTYLEEGMALQRLRGDRRMMAITLNGLGTVAYHQVEYQQAIALYEESLGVLRDLGDQRTVPIVLSNLGRVLEGLGEHREAGALQKASLLQFQELGDKEGIANCLERLAVLITVAPISSVAVSLMQQAAGLFGAAEALREAIAAPVPPSGRDLYDRQVAAMRTALGMRGFTAAWAAGRGRSLVSTIAAATELAESRMVE